MTIQQTKTADPAPLQISMKTLQIKGRSPGRYFMVCDVDVSDDGLTDRLLHASKKFESGREKTPGSFDVSRINSPLRASRRKSLAGKL